MRKARSLVAAWMAVFLFVCTAVSAARRPREVALRWAPTSPLTELGWIDLSGVGRRSVEIGRFADERSRPDRIGEIREDELRVEPVTSGDDVAIWVTDGIRDVLGRVGLRVVEREGDLVITGAVRHALITERGPLQAEVALWILVNDAAGETVWEGLVLGGATGPGRFDRDRAYSEALSDAVLAAVVRLLENGTFTEALGATEP